jgi:cytochrome c5
MAMTMIGLALAACTAVPSGTGTVCPAPDPTTLGYDTQYDPQCTQADGAGSGMCFGKAFMDHYCTMCHASTLTLSQRNGAPLFHDFDTLEGVLEVPDHIDEQAGIGPTASNHFMPGTQCPSTPGGPLDGDCAQPTDAERTQLAEWIACARARTYDFRDAGVPSDAP